ncbi:MAG: DUF2155 domain-containing protein [Methylovirgula sp.]
MQRRARGVLVSFLSLGLALAISGPAAADKIKHSIAVFSGLDKITGRIISFEVSANETVQFGSLLVTDRVCYTRPPTEAPQTDTFVQVDEVDANKNTNRIFSGWMFAASPGLNALDHPIYDIWLTDCKAQRRSSPRRLRRLRRRSRRPRRRHSKRRKIPTLSLRQHPHRSNRRGTPGIARSNRRRTCKTDRLTSARRPASRRPPDNGGDDDQAPPPQVPGMLPPDNNNNNNN